MSKRKNNRLGKAGITFYTYATERIREKRLAGKHNTADLYRTTRNWICAFLGRRNLLFPILSPGREVGHEEYKAILRSYNNSLKKIGRALSRPIHLTSYVFRHTWATNALRKQVPLSIISQALGHTSEKTTRFYLASLEQSELNRANARVTEEVDLLLAAG